MKKIKKTNLIWGFLLLISGITLVHGATSPLITPQQALFQLTIGILMAVVGCLIMLVVSEL